MIHNPVNTIRVIVWRMRKGFKQVTSQLIYIQLQFDSYSHYPVMFINFCHENELKNSQETIQAVIRGEFVADHSLTYW